MIRRSGFILLLALLLVPTAQADPSAIQRGAYLFALGGCASCHTDSDNGGEPLAGGLAMPTPFGTFYTPNISADPQQGIGAWSNADFIRAMRRGISPEDEHYYPAFPYTAYSLMSDAELHDLKAYLDSQPASAVPSKAHQLNFPFRYRSLLALWKWLYLDGQRFSPDPNRSEQWNRGAYIVNGPGHCVECHSPRTLLGGLDSDHLLEGTPDGPDGETVPGLTAASNPEFGQWLDEDIQFALETGMMLNGDFFSGTMGKVVDNSTSQLSEADRAAIAVYLKSFAKPPQ
ncbi:diheme cytochrome C-type [Motiliproteus coralliicola]|uniref:Diheme cytochrome C-type n=1 Tax=Motiliproteus coralliicola TaxID=2283196 RepID=A0A369WDP0_9GAMM|nr:cytochrome c [Motiliproteus coralliicola]RDE18736.1 diheme cytochrome C-type [Motiliproteus coralliicola]